VYSSNPREGGYTELAIHGPLWAVQGHMGHSYIYTLTVCINESWWHCYVHQVNFFFATCWLQPPSIVTDVDCTACDFNRPGKNCLRKLEWVWRGETYMAKKKYTFQNYVIWNLWIFWSNAIIFCSDYYHIKRQIESELIQSGGIASSKPFLDLSKPEHLLKLKDRLKKYCQKVLFFKHVGRFSFGEP
jgi:hypothetical protein